MNVESLREYCLSLPLATEDFPFDETTLVFRVVGKIFAMLDLERPDVVSLKCNPDYALQLREEHPEISGAWHMNKKYWNQVNLSGHLEDELVQGLVRHSYAEVVKKLTRKERAEHEEITTVRE
ncbi:MAG: MmcQ/YjbR family DNA-binding protein [Bacteroidaceae bacterium]|jgi:predicted DNA-binding protein (MmcQ/YjbR family)|nr:MmcQ/YjbR family DNA-binding protein [Bacteroidaceae bacterium]